MNSLSRLLCFAALPLMTVGTASASLFQPSYTASVTFDSPSALEQTIMTLAYDGTRYWNASGGGSWGTRLAELDGSGTLLNTYEPGLDFRSVFTDGSGNLYAREFASSIVYKQSTPGTFSAFATLDGSLDAQSAVVLNGAGTEFIAMSGGTVQRWDLAGNILSSVALSGWGLNSETNYPADRGIAAFGSYWLTYSQGILSAWDQAGNRVDQTTLVGAGTTFDSHFSLSFANNMVFIADSYPGNGQWRGYQIGTASVPDAASTFGLFGLAALGLVWLRRRLAPSVRA